jgi:uncharacterized membrane-anchored protein
MSEKPTTTGDREMDQEQKLIARLEAKVKVLEEAHRRIADLDECTDRRAIEAKEISLAALQEPST